MTPINLRAAEARQLLAAGRVEVVRVMRPQPESHWYVGGGLDADDANSVKPDRWPFAAPGAVVACREPFIAGWDVDCGEVQQFDEDGDELPCRYWYKADDNPHLIWFKDTDSPTDQVPWLSSTQMPRAAIRLHARVESRGAEVRDGKWCWVAVVVKTEKGGGECQN